MYAGEGETFKSGLVEIELVEQFELKGWSMEEALRLRPRVAGTDAFDWRSKQSGREERCMVALMEMFFK
jgi:hypothetical protein